MNYRTALLAVLVSLVVCAPAAAHPHHPTAGPNGLMAGFAHPWLGFDHLLAMVAVGMLGVQVGGRAIWILPVAFLGCLALGGAIGATGFEWQQVEVGIALSVVLLGAALAAGKKFPLLAAAIAIGGMALFHGHAHGTEMPAMAAPALYALGFMAATAMLHAVGITVAVGLSRTGNRSPALRLSGAVISFAGVVLLLGTV